AKPTARYLRARTGLPALLRSACSLRQPFSWRDGYSFLHAPVIRARRFFATEGRLEGFGYMVDAEGERVAAPVVVKDHTNVALPPEAMLGSRMVLLDFEPEAGYWESA